MALWAFLNTLGSNLKAAETVQEQKMFNHTDDFIGHHE
jgi:hypothetical protein